VVPFTVRKRESGTQPPAVKPTATRKENFHQMCNPFFLGAESAFLYTVQFVISLFLRLRSPEGTLEVRCARRWSDLGADDQPCDILWVQRLDLFGV